MRIFILGVNGFIGNALARRILAETSWNISGIDVERDRVEHDILEQPRFEFLHGDISISREWVELEVKRADIILPLAAVAIPKIYIEDPLRVFELDFLENLRIVQMAVKHKKRLVFPSSSEVYGMAQGLEFDEESSNLVLGPVNKQRWIYGCAKQLLDRVIHAYGLQRGLRYSIFRPFNWVGPHLDRVDEKIGNSRVVTQFISDIAFNRPIQLVNGGAQRRCFLYLDDGIDALLRILKNENGGADQRIFNIGNPANEISIGEMAELLVHIYRGYPRASTHPFHAGIHAIEGEVYYGKGYQDMTSRRPKIEKARRHLGWRPRFNLEETLRRTFEWFLEKGLPAPRGATDRDGAPHPVLAAAHRR